MLHSNWALPLGLIQTASSPEEESGVEIGERTMADLSAVQSGRAFLVSLGALLARRMGRVEDDGDVDGGDAAAVDCCEVIYYEWHGLLEGQKPPCRWRTTSVGNLR